MDKTHLRRQRIFLLLSGLCWSI